MLGFEIGNSFRAVIAIADSWLQTHKYNLTSITVWIVNVLTIQVCIKFYTLIFAFFIDFELQILNEDRKMWGFYYNLCKFMEIFQGE